MNINAYTIHDTSEWKDLNLKFVLQVEPKVKIRIKIKLLNILVMNYASKVFNH